MHPKTIILKSFNFRKNREEKYIKEKKINKIIKNIFKINKLFIYIYIFKFIFFI